MAKSTTDLNISCAQTGTSFATDITQALVAINSAHRGSTEPTYNVEDGMMWLDTSSSDYKLKMRIGSVWKVLLDLNSGVFESPGETALKTRVDGNDDKHDGTTTSSPNISALKINGTTVLASTNELNYSDGVTSNIQAQLTAKNSYTHPTTAGNIHIPAGGTTNQVLTYLSDGTAQWASAAAGAPPSASVGQTELKTTTGTFSQSASSGTHTLPGGEYGFIPQFREDAGSTGSSYSSDGVVTGSTYASKVILTNSSGTLYGRQTYVTASPPYDLGDGNIPLFVFAGVDEDNNIKSTYVSITPPWAYNGPTNIKPDFYKDGVGYQNKGGEVVEVTQAIKNADMDLIPHPFGSDMDVVMFDPFSDVISSLLNAENPSEFINNNVSITGTASFTTPPGVKPVSVELK